jgi:membrane protein DedA with SNARE-associated domain
VKEAKFVLTQLTQTLTNLITNLYVTTGLVGIIIAMAIESCCIPLPSELVMPLAGIMITQGKLLPGMNPIVAVLIVAVVGSIGCLLGSTVAYWIGYAGGRPLLLKYGRYVLISQHDSDRADYFFHRWGSITTFFSRLLPVIRTYISLPAGIAKMPFWKFCMYTLLGSLPWCFVLAYIGTIIGNNLGVLSPVFHYLDIIILVALVLLVVLFIWRHIKNDREARTAQESNQRSTSQEEAQQPVSSQQAWRQPSTPFQPQQQQPQFQQWQQQQNPPSTPFTSQQQQQNPPSTPFTSQQQQQGWGQQLQQPPPQLPDWATPPAQFRQPPLQTWMPQQDENDQTARRN